MNVFFKFFNLFTAVLAAPHFAKLTSLEYPLKLLFWNFGSVTVTLIWPDATSSGSLDPIVIMKLESCKYNSN